jgi:hypothetical protein
MVDSVCFCVYCTDNFKGSAMPMHKYFRPGLDPLWATAGELHCPVMVYVADSVAFFAPLEMIND